MPGEVGINDTFGKERYRGAAGCVDIVQILACPVDFGDGKGPLPRRLVFHFMHTLWPEGESEGKRALYLPCQESKDCVLCLAVRKDKRVKRSGWPDPRDKHYVCVVAHYARKPKGTEMYVPVCKVLPWGFQSRSSQGKAGVLQGLEKQLIELDKAHGKKPRALNQVKLRVECADSKDAETYQKLTIALWDMPKLPVAFDAEQKAKLEEAAREARAVETSMLAQEVAIPSNDELNDKLADILGASDFDFGENSEDPGRVVQEGSMRRLDDDTMDQLDAEGAGADDDLLLGG